MHDGVRDYLKRKADRKRGQSEHMMSHRGTDSYSMDYRVHGYNEDHARQRFDHAMSRRRGRKRDSSYGVGHYIYETPVPYHDGKSYDEEYDKDLQEWTKRLKEKDNFGLSKSEVVRHAIDMNVQFEEYTEQEFYTVYLMMVSDFNKIANNPQTYVAMAKAWLEDDDIAVSPSEKLCKYMYEIVLDV